MSTASEPIPRTTSPDVARGVLIRLGQIAAGLGLEALILFVGAGRLDWIWAWVFLGINVVSVTVNATLLSRTNLETIAERGRGITHMKGWDRAIAGVWSAAQYIAIPLVSGLDVRFGWTPELSSVDHVAGGVILASGLELMSWAMIVNAYFSTAARVQTERGQTVCRTGPYRVVRHPGYAGAIQQSLGTPFLLGSAWALIAAVVAVVAIVARTILEDRMLQAELPGYAAYAREVRYHLIPGIW